MSQSLAYLSNKVEKIESLISKNSLTVNSTCLESNPEESVKLTRLEDWIDNQDVMRILHISLRTLQTLRSNGTLSYSRINNKIYYRRQDIQNILADNYVMFKIRNEYGKNG